MPQKFISLDDAADQLGVTKERLNELREAGDLRAYRDGASWKFRTEEIDKLAESGELTAGDNAGVMDEDDEDELILGIEPLGDGDDAESILLTDDDDLEGGLPRPQSTIIGKSELSLEDDLALASNDDLDLAEATKPVSAEAGESKASTFDDLEELELDLEAESSRILDPSTAAAAKEAAEKSSAPPADEPSDLKLDIEEDYELELSGSATDVTNQGDPKSDSGSGSGAPGSIAGLSGLDAIDLDEDEQDDMVLGDSDPSLGTSDSGINLAPSDSGIALDDVPLDLGGSAIGSALDLAALSAASAAQSKINDDVSLASAEDFELTPVSADNDDDEEDSSQIVALDDFQDEGNEEEEAAFEEVEELGEGFGSALGAGMPSGAGASMSASAAVPTASASVEQVAFPGWIIAMLGISMLSMIFCGMMAFDLLQSMWAWDEPFSVNSALMDVFAGN